jgi:hypothetical protein
MHSYKLIGEAYTSNVTQELQQKIASSLGNIRILSTRYDSSVENSKPKQYSLTKLLEATKNKTEIYDSSLSAMYADLGTLTIPGIANSIPWLTYLNTIVITIVLIKVFKCPNPFPFVYSANLQSTKAMPTSTMGMPSLQQVDTYLDSVVTICVVLLLIMVVIYFCKRPREIVQTSTLLKIILFSEEEEIGLPLGKTLYKIDMSSRLTSENMEEKPILTLGKKLNINWQGYVLRTEEGDFELPNYIRVMPWQQRSLRTIIPKLIIV